MFFVGVKTTGIYCRPVCTAKTPGRDRCRFFASAALAEQAGFRPCLRCRPELAPGHAPVDSARTIARAAAARIEAGALDNGGSLEELAASLGLSSRQLRRSVRKELGVSPVELAQTNRLLLAKRLIAETQLPMVQVAFAAGFESVRRFNALFRSHYRLTPSTLRRSSSKAAAADCLRLVLAYRPPLDWDAMLRFLAARAIPGVECVTECRVPAHRRHRRTSRLAACFAGRRSQSAGRRPGHRAGPGAAVDSRAPAESVRSGCSAGRHRRASGTRSAAGAVGRAAARVARAGRFRFV